MPNDSAVTKRTSIDVVCLVAIDQDGKILATQRAKDKPLPLVWEFPGGKIDAGESAEYALRREIVEELGIELGELSRLPRVTHQYEFGVIQLIPFLRKMDTHPKISKLNAHAATQWIALGKWNQLQWAPADLPIIDMLLNTE